MKILIVLEGGLVSAVYSSTDVDVTVVDYDRDRGAEQNQVLEAMAASLIKKHDMEDCLYGSLSTDADNLDAMPADDLERYTPDEAFGAPLVVQLRCYAVTKALAMRHRLAGEIQAAMYLEDECMKIYNGLPEWVRW